MTRHMHVQYRGHMIHNLHHEASKYGLMIMRRYNSFLFLPATCSLLEHVTLLLEKQGCKCNRHLWTNTFPQLMWKEINSSAPPHTAISLRI